MRYCLNDECEHFVNIGARAEFLDHVERCSDCGTALVSQLPPMPPPDPGTELVVVDSYRTVHDAALARSRLEADGIQTWLGDEYINQVDPWLSPAVGWVKLLVCASDLDQARKALRTDDSTLVDQLSVGGVIEGTTGPADVEERNVTTAKRLPIEAYWLILALMSLIAWSILSFLTR